MRNNREKFTGQVTANSVHSPTEDTSTILHPTISPGILAKERQALGQSPTYSFSASTEPRWPQPHLHIEQELHLSDNVASLSQNKDF